MCFSSRMEREWDTFFSPFCSDLNLWGAASFFFSPSLTFPPGIFHTINFITKTMPSDFYQKVVEFSMNHHKMLPGFQVKENHGEISSGNQSRDDH